jgi:hypothetical protein
MDLQTVFSQHAVEADREPGIEKTATTETDIPDAGLYRNPEDQIGRFGVLPTWLRSRGLS